MSDNLGALTAQQLSEVFAVEVAGWVWRHSYGAHAVPTRRMLCPPSWKSPASWGEEIFKKGLGLPSPAGVIVEQFSPFPDFATSADAVLPYLEQHPRRQAVDSVNGWLIAVGYARGGLHYDHAAIAPTFARAACIAMIKAKRAEKEAEK